jgi:hypothetical protein
MCTGGLLEDSEPDSGRTYSENDFAFAWEPEHVTDLVVIHEASRVGRTEQLRHGLHSIPQQPLPDLVGAPASPGREGHRR